MVCYQRENKTTVNETYENSNYFKVKNKIKRERHALFQDFFLKKKSDFKENHDLSRNIRKSLENYNISIILESTI
jgi:hypothetical protein